MPDVIEAFDKSKSTNAVRMYLLLYRSLRNGARHEDVKRFGRMALFISILVNRKIVIASPI